MGDDTIDENDFGADVAAGLIVAHQLAVRPVTVFFHPTSIIKPDSGGAGAGFALYDVGRWAPGDIDRVRSHADLYLTAVDEVFEVGREGGVGGRAFLFAGRDAGAGATGEREEGEEREKR